MAQDLALLPLWYGGGGLVVAEGSANREYLSQLKTLLPLKSELIAFHEIAHYPPETLCPWGWNPALRKRLMDAGVQEDRLPSLADLERLREYSNRKNAVKILASLKSLNPHFCGESHFFTDMDALRSYLSSFGGDKLLKMPLSGSGKGIIRIIGAMTDKQADWCLRVIRRQGGVVAEPVFDKVQDCAMEFQFSGGKTRFVAYSLFSAGASGAYIGNELLFQDEIEERLSRSVERRLLEELKSELETRLSSCFPRFDGFMGVDMMLCRNEDGRFSLHPCVEINMRMNMGIVAHCFVERFLRLGSKGIFRIEFFKEKTKALSFTEEMRKRRPLVVENGKIRSGFLALTAVNEDTNYVGYASI